MSDRITARVQTWLKTRVRTFPDSAGGPAATVQVCTEAKRHANSVIAVVDLSTGSDEDLAGQLSEVITSQVELMTSRGVTFYLYALSASGDVLLGAFPVLLKPGDTTSAMTLDGAGAGAKDGGDAATFGRVAQVLLRGEREYSGALAQQNLDTLNAAAESFVKLGDLQRATTEVLQQQSTALLEQLRAANERAAEAEKRARDLERQLAESMKDHRETMSLLGDALDKAEQLQKRIDEKTDGPFAEAKRDLINQLVGGVKEAVVMKVAGSVNGHAAAATTPDPAAVAAEEAAAADVVARLGGAKGDA